MQDLIAQKIFSLKFWLIKRHHLMRSFTKPFLIAILGSLALCACTAAKFEARLEANPQCKDVINPKTGAVMPCPGSDKAFYRSVGLEPAKTAAPPAANSAEPVVKSSSPVSSSSTTPKASPELATPQPDCKPQLHKKTGGMMPCPSSD